MRITSRNWIRPNCSREYPRLVDEAQLIAPDQGQLLVTFERLLTQATRCPAQCRHLSIQEFKLPS